MTPRPHDPTTHTVRVLLLAALFGAAPLAATRAARSARKPAAQSKAEKTYRAKVAARKAKIVALRSRLKNLSAKKQEMRQDLHESRVTQHRLSDQLNQSYEQLETAQSALKQSAAKLQQAQVAVQGAEQRLKIAEERLAVQRQRFGRRIAISYKAGPVSYADVLLGSRNLSDLMDRQYYVSRVVSHDAELLSALRQAQQEVAWQRHLLVQKQGELAQAHRENADWVQRVQAQAEAREKLLRAVQHEAALQEQQLRELEEDSQDVQNALERELARRLAHPQSFRALPSWNSHFFMPAHGRVTSGFGYRYHPVLHYTRLHSGIDIGVGVGSPVYAAADGEVFFASVRGGYGRCIIVLHGGNISTLYGHLSRIDVRPGQSVRRGQMIGASGNSGLSTGPHLHFEVRRNGVPVNPL